MSRPIGEKQLAIIKNWLGSGSINLFGLPFAGKDTHGKILADIFKAPLLSGGDILRNSTLPAHVKSIMDRGGLAPTEDYVRIVLPYLSKPEFQNRPLILSSVGRWIGEEGGVITAAEASQHPLKAVIYLHLDDDGVMQRFHTSKKKGDRGNRADDAEHLLETRIKEFHNKTEPVIEIYRERGLLIEINSEATLDEVSESIMARLFVLATS